MLTSVGKLQRVSLIMSGDHNMCQKSKSYLDDFECPRCGHCCKAEANKEMKPKFMQLLERCIVNGVILGHNQAYKHNPTPERYEINQSICNEVMNEIHEWFDFDEGKL
jgi:hypothetical protein